MCDDEYQIYSAVLSLVQFPKNDPHAVINDLTLNLQCGENSQNPVLLNGCSPMRANGETPQEISVFLRENFRNSSKATVDSFNLINQKSIRIKDNIATPWKHRLAGTDIQDDGSPEWASPDMAFFLSGVGFNSQRTEAIVFVLNFSYLDKVPTEGDYFLFRRKGKTWQPDGRVTYVQNE